LVSALTYDYPFDHVLYLPASSNYFPSEEEDNNEETKDNVNQQESAPVTPEKKNVLFSPIKLKEGHSQV